MAMAYKKIVRLVRVRGGKVREVTFLQLRRNSYLATNEVGNTIRVAKEGVFWSANNGGGRTYFHVNPAQSFAAAANAFWKLREK